MDELLKEIKFKQIPVDKDKIYTNLKSRIERNENQTLTFDVPRRNRFLIIYKIAAAVCSLILISSLTYYVLSTNDINYIEVNGIAGTKTKVVLSDGSTIWLNGDSKLVYPEKFKKAKREISFEGEGVFEVAKDRRKPFVVNLGDSKVEVLGTIFNIDTKTDDIIEATLIEGSIAFYTGDKDVPSVVMKPDEQIVYEKKTNKLLLKEVKGENYMSWINNNFRFEDEPIYSIAEQLERGFGVKINIKNDRLGQMKITGTFNHEETLDEILSIIQITASLRWKKDIDGEYYIE